VVVEGKRLPPSRMSSEGGSGGDNPLHLAFRAREGGGDGRTMSPSVSHFERGREWGVGEGGSRGGGGRQMSPSVSRLEQGRDRQPPPSRISSERG
jgi:hypothetical protein